MEIEVFVSPQLMESQSSELLDERLNIPNDLVLADPDFGQPWRKDLLLDTEINTRLINPGIIDSKTDKPTLQETTVRWIFVPSANSIYKELPRIGTYT